MESAIIEENVIRAASLGNRPSYASLNKKFICSSVTMDGNVVFHSDARRSLIDEWALPANYRTFGCLGVFLTYSSVMLDVTIDKH